MTANDLAAVVNIGLAIMAVAAMRAYWPRAPLRPGYGPGRLFYAAFLVLGVSVAMNAAAWGIWRFATAADLWWADPLRVWFAWGDAFWKGMSAVGFWMLLRAKLAALAEDERAKWNVITVIWHPNSDAVAVRIFISLAALPGRFRKRG